MGIKKDFYDFRKNKKLALKQAKEVNLSCFASKLYPGEQWISC